MIHSFCICKWDCLLKFAYNSPNWSLWLPCGHLQMCVCESIQNLSHLIVTFLADLEQSDIVSYFLKKKTKSSLTFLCHTLSCLSNLGAEGIFRIQEMESPDSFMWFIIPFYVQSSYGWLSLGRNGFHRCDYYLKWELPWYHDFFLRWPMNISGSPQHWQYMDRGWMDFSL